MKRITSITTSNFKGEGRVGQDIAPRTLLTGPNGSGKTRVLQAIAAALTGGVPPLDRKGFAALASPSAGAMALTLDVEGGPSVNRGWNSGGGSLTGEAVTFRPTRGRPGAKAGQAIIDEELCSSPVMIDLGHFLRMTPAKRGEQLASLLGDRAEVSAEDFIRELIECSGASTLPQETEGAIRAAWSDSKSAPDNLAQAVAIVADQLKVASATQREAEGAMRRADEEARQDNDIPETAADLSQRRSGLQAERDKLRDELAQDSERAKAAEAMNKARAGAEAAMERESQDLDEAKSEAERFTAEHAQAAKELKAAQDAPEIQVATGKPPKDCPEIAAYRGEHARYCDIESEIELEQARGSALRKSMVLGAGSDCPTCRQTVSEAALEVISNALQESEHRASKLSGDLRMARSRIEETGRVAQRVERKFEERQRASEAEARNRTQNIDRAQLAADAAKARLGQANATIERHTKRLEEAKSRHLEARRESVDQPGGIDREIVQRQITTLDSQISEIGQQIAKKEQARGLMGAALKAQEDAAAARASAKVLRELVTAARKAMGVIVGRAMAPIIDRANSLLTRVDPGWRMDLDLSKGLDIAAVTGDTAAIPFGSLSGGEVAVFGSALAIAVIDLIDPPLRVLMIEAAEVDEERLPAFLEALDTLGEGMGNIIVATCHAVQAPEAWDTVRLGECAGVVA